MILTVSMEVSISFYLLILYMDNWLIEPLQLIAGRREKLFWKAKLPGKAVRSPIENSRVGRSRLLFILSVKHIFLCEADGKYLWSNPAPLFTLTTVLPSQPITASRTVPHEQRNTLSKWDRKGPRWLC